MTPLLAAVILACTTTSEPISDASELPQGAPPDAAARVAAPASRDVHVANAWIRAMPPGSLNTAAFMQLHNGGPSATALVGARTDVAGVVELHTHVPDGDVLKMQQIERIDLPVDAQVELESHGLHLMLLGLHGDLALGQEVSLELVFEDGSQQQFTVAVQQAPAPTKAQPAALQGTDEHGDHDAHAGH